MGHGDDRACRLDFKVVAEAALAASDRLVPQWLPDGHRAGHEWKARNPRRDDRRIGSFSVNLTTGQWGDFATDDTGGDLVSLYAYLFTAGDQGEAAKKLAADLRIDALTESAPAQQTKSKRKPAWDPVVPVPESATPAPIAHPYRGRPKLTWAYRDRDGRLLGYVYRFETSDGGKELIPLVWARNVETGKHEWRWQQWARPRPLYGMEHWVAGRPVLVVEGEKCVDAARSVLGDRFNIVTWPGGGKAVHLADWFAARPGAAEHCRPIDHRRAAPRPSRRAGGLRRGGCPTTAGGQFARPRVNASGALGKGSAKQEFAAE